MTEQANGIQMEPSEDILRRLARDPRLTSAERIALRQGAAAIAIRKAEAKGQPERPRRPPDYYRVEPAWEWRDGDPGERGFQIVNASVLTCMATGQVLAGMGGCRDALHPDVVAMFRKGWRIDVPEEAKSENNGG